VSKKDVERAYLERFRSLIPDFPPGRIEATEEPDFLVHQPASILGLELTDLHRDTPSGIRPQQADEAMRHRVVARAQTLYVASGNPPVRVSVFFNQHHQIQKLDVEQLARCIADLATRNLPAQGTSREQGYDWVNRAYFPEAIHKIKVQRSLVHLAQLGLPHSRLPISNALCSPKSQDTLSIGTGARRRG